MILFKDDIGREDLLTATGTSSVFVLSPAAYSRADNLYELEITGDGVSNPMTFTMDQLQDLKYTSRFIVLSTLGYQEVLYSQGSD